MQTLKRFYVYETPAPNTGAGGIYEVRDRKTLVDNPETGLKMFKLVQAGLTASEARVITLEMNETPLDTVSE